MTTLRRARGHSGQGTVGASMGSQSVNPSTKSGQERAENRFGMTFSGGMVPYSQRQEERALKRKTERQLFRAALPEELRDCSNNELHRMMKRKSNRKLLRQVSKAAQRQIAEFATKQEEARAATGRPRLVKEPK